MNEDEDTAFAAMTTHQVPLDLANSYAATAPTGRRAQLPQTHPTAADSRPSSSQIATISARRACGHEAPVSAGLNTAIIIVSGCWALTRFVDTGQGP